MRNAVAIGNDFIVTTDNSGGIGEKPADLVKAPDRITAYFAARVALLEQWAANAVPVAVLIHNFSGSSSWDAYVAGVTDLFHEARLEAPEISGSTETNIPLIQSALAVTMIGKRGSESSSETSDWYTFGYPLVGNEVLNQPEKVASLQLLNEAKEAGLIQQLWPVGSHGILQEVRALMGDVTMSISTELDVTTSAGPSTVVLLAIPRAKRQQAKSLFGNLLKELQIQQ